jgi:hypothetical protein
MLSVHFKNVHKGHWCPCYVNKKCCKGETACQNTGDKLFVLQSAKKGF